MSTSQILKFFSSGYGMVFPTGPMHDSVVLTTINLP